MDYFAPNDGGSTILYVAKRKGIGVYARKATFFRKQAGEKGKADTGDQTILVVTWILLLVAWL